MPHPFLSFFTACITGGQKAILKKRSRKTDQCKNYLPDELIIESILTRLPFRTLAVCCCVSKSWHDSILNDSRFSAVHNTQNKSKVSLVFNLLNNVSRGGQRGMYFFSLLGREKAMDIRILSGFPIETIYEIVGFCNGLVCVNQVGVPTDTFGIIAVINPNRCETLNLCYLRPTGGYIYLCHGFGFDPLSQVYKVVIIFNSQAYDEFLCMVITLGTMSWRKIVTRIVDISPPQGSSPFPSPMVTRVSRTLCRQATFCRGDLFWRTSNNGINMLLSFDLHNEKIQFIRLPTECAMTTAATTERQYLADDHLMEFKGYPCIARSDRINTTSNNDHCGHRCNYQTGACCCCYKVHMYILKDKEKQVWSKEETFDVQIMDQEGLLPTPLCCSFDISTTPTPPTRILTSSDQVLLYWFNGERLIFYNLQEKHLKVVECARTYPGAFRTKMNERLERLIGDDSNIDCPSMDYQLLAQEENIMTLKTFVPKGAFESNSADEMLHSVVDKVEAGWLSIGRAKHIYYAFSLS